jgi:hypothetical protein
VTPTDERPPTSDIEQEKPATRRGVIVMRVIGAVVLVLLVLPVLSMLQPRYYDRYADMREAMGHWRESTHARMTCGGCHIEPGVKGFASFALQSIPAFYSQLVQGPTDTNILGAPSTEACGKCHTSYRVVSPGGDLLIPHRAHVQVLKVNCVDCHEELVHYANLDGVNKPKMTLCMERCHDGEKATEECVDCHTNKNVPESHKRADWGQVHSQETKNEDCGSCHEWSPNYCDECHRKRPGSHDGNFKKLHAPRAKVSDKGCRFCHAEEFCKKCH